MSDIRNLLPDPKPSSTAKWSTYASKDISLQMFTDNRLHITNNANIADSYIYTQLHLPAGTYRFGAEVSYPQNGYASNLLRMVVVPRTELDPATWDGTPGRIVTPANTVPEDSTVEFRIMVGPNAGSEIWVRHLFVMTDSDYQQMIAQGVTWFDGDGIVRGGFLLAFSVHMWIAAMIWWWSHEQAHHPTRRTAGHRLQKLCAQPETGHVYQRACERDALIGCGCEDGRCPAQRLSARRDLQHGHPVGHVGGQFEHGRGGEHHPRPVQSRLSAGHDQGRDRKLSARAQRGRRRIQTVALRVHVVGRDGRIQDYHGLSGRHLGIQRLLSVSHAATTGLGVAA